MPRVIVLAGVNGAGKTSAAIDLLRDVYQSAIFVNADTIARGLNALDPEAQSFAAGRIVLRMLKQLSAERKDFAFETTLATRSYAPFLATLRELGYEVHLHFYWLNSVELAISRVQARVAAGGHDIPETTIRRRFPLSLRNFFELYQSLANTWNFYDNSNGTKITIAKYESGLTEIFNTKLWEHIQHDES